MLSRLFPGLAICHRLPLIRMPEEIPFQFCPQDDFPRSEIRHKPMRLFQPAVKLSLAESEVTSCLLRCQDVFRRQWYRLHLHCSFCFFIPIYHSPWQISQRFTANKRNLYRGGFVQKLLELGPDNHVAAAVVDGKPFRVLLGKPAKVLDAKIEIGRGLPDGEHVFLGDGDDDVLFLLFFCHWNDFHHLYPFSLICFMTSVNFSGTVRPIRAAFSMMEMPSLAQ